MTDELKPGDIVYIEAEAIEPRAAARKAETGRRTSPVRRSA